MALNGTGLSEKLNPIAKEEKVLNSMVECVVLSSDDEDNKQKTIPIVSLKNPLVIKINSTKTKEVEKSTKPGLLFNAITRPESKNSLEYLGLTHQAEIPPTKHHTPFQSFVKSCDKKDSNIEPLPIRIVEAHSLPPNLWICPDDSMDMPSTSTNNQDLKPTKDRPTENLDSFINELRQLGDSTDKDLRDILAKLRKKGLQCGEDYFQSYQFIVVKEDIINKILKDQKNFYIYLQEVKNNFQQNIARTCKTKLHSEKNGKLDVNSSNDAELEKRIDHLHKILAKLHKEIQKCENKELSLDDLEEDNSHYIYEQKLKKKFNDAYTLICKLERRDTKTGRPIHLKLSYEGTRYPEINKAVRKCVNRKVLYFPDFAEINKIVETKNQDSCLGLSENQIFSLAQEIFEDIGKEIQARRQEDFLGSLTAFVPDDVDSSQDPSMDDPELKEKLKKNGEESKIRMNKVIEEFVEKQHELKLEAKEVDDDEAKLSPVEDDSSEDEESDDDNDNDLNDVLGSDAEEIIDNVDDLPDITENSVGSPSSESSKSVKRKYSKDLNTDLSHSERPFKKSKSDNGVEDDIIILD